MLGEPEAPAPPAGEPDTPPVPAPPEGMPAMGMLVGMHIALRQRVPSGQRVPQAPQCALSFVVLVQLLLQHVDPASQRLPQAPQFCGSRRVLKPSSARPLQSSSAPLQTSVEAMVSERHVGPDPPEQRSVPIAQGP